MGRMGSAKAHKAALFRQKYRLSKKAAACLRRPEILSCGLASAHLTHDGHGGDRGQGQ